MNQISDELLRENATAPSKETIPRIIENPGVELLELGVFSMFTVTIVVAVLVPSFHVMTASTDSSTSSESEIMVQQQPFLLQDQP